MRREEKKILPFKLIRVVRALFLPFLLHFHLLELHAFQYICAPISNFYGKIIHFTCSMYYDLPCMPLTAHFN